jgi:hypothetical protein
MVQNGLDLAHTLKGVCIYVLSSLDGKIIRCGGRIYSTGFALLQITYRFALGLRKNDMIELVTCLYDFQLSTKAPSAEFNTRDQKLVK